MTITGRGHEVPSGEQQNETQVLHDPSKPRQRRLRGRPTAAAAGVMAGVLAGAGGMAWQAGKLPMQKEHRAAACWGAFSHKEQTGLMPDLEEDRLWSEEIPARGELTTERSRGECRLGRGEIARPRQTQQQGHDVPDPGVA
ncbi:hypothetical protein [Streptomyces sp. 3N207]|uniref:hypothetical protein n=1 Tax=Streptomyces sp. 3N207 TaxID=3457417 RepID=UPI003FD4CDB7